MIEHIDDFNEAVEIAEGRESFDCAERRHLEAAIEMVHYADPSD